MQTTEGISLEVDLECDSRLYDFELFVCNPEAGELEQEAALDVEAFFEELDFDLAFDSAFDLDSEWSSELSSSYFRFPFFLAAVPVFLLVLVLSLALVLFDLMNCSDFLF
jgi:hypothetical protein